ncbi:uncharacterized protein LOC120114263 [Hibiscus syriacus]|uniref:uncharacterized protein LOC120114263 n=1 Tax=Hibiscus syriacus TaxID=106335 RepID=UPI001922ED10|nr:uncharacterized protein LOC120114263 [Hibiscus syriacus]
MGLNETYSTIRSQILIMRPLSTVNQAYSIIAQEESQRLQLSEGSIETFVMFSNVLKGADRRRFSGTCEYCKIKGHRKENFYRLIGFPPDFKFTRKKSPQAAMAMGAESNDLSKDLGLLISSPASVVPTFTSEQYNQILGLLNQAPTSDSCGNLAGSLQWQDHGDW